MNDATPHPPSTTPHPPSSASTHRPFHTYHSPRLRNFINSHSAPTTPSSSTTSSLSQTTHILASSSFTQSQLTPLFSTPSASGATTPHTPHTAPLTLPARVRKKRRLREAFRKALVRSINPNNGTLLPHTVPILCNTNGSVGQSPLCEKCKWSDDTL